MSLSDTPAPVRRYTVTGLIKGAAATEEIRTLLQNWVPGEDHQALLARVRSMGLLGKATDRRTADMVLRVFKPRLLSPTDAPARRLQLYLQGHWDEGVFREMLLLHEARVEPVLYDFILQKFWPACRSGALWLRLNDALEFLDAAVRTGHIAADWSVSTQQRTASALLQALTAFGFLREARSQQREIVPYRLTDAGLAYLAHDLHFDGRSDAALVDDPDWGLFGLDRRHLVERLDALDERAGLIVQRAGDVVRLSWSHPTMESLLYAFTR